MAPTPRVQVIPRGQLAPRVYQYRSPQVWELNMERDIERAVEGALAGVRALVEIDALDDVEADDEVRVETQAPSARRSATPRAVPAPVAPAAPSASFMVRTSWSPADASAAFVARTSSRTASSRTLALPGLRASAMDRDLAAYFGEDLSIGEGLLVLEADERWDSIRVGDVIVEVNGRRVKGDASAVCLDRSKDNRVTVVRKGKRETLMLRAV